MKDIEKKYKLSSDVKFCIFMCALSLAGYIVFECAGDRASAGVMVIVVNIYVAAGIMYMRDDKKKAYFDQFMERLNDETQP